MEKSEQIDKRVFFRRDNIPKSTPNFDFTYKEILHSDIIQNIESNLNDIRKDTEIDNNPENSIYDFISEEDSAESICTVKTDNMASMITSSREFLGSTIGGCWSNKSIKNDLSNVISIFNAVSVENLFNPLKLDEFITEEL